MTRWCGQDIAECKYNSGCDNCMSDWNTYTFIYFDVLIAAILRMN